MGTSLTRWLAVAALVIGVGRVLVAQPEWAGWQPVPDSPSYVTGAESLARGDGYRVDVPGFPSTPMYPPGLSLLLIPAVWIDGVQTASTLISAFLLAMAWLTSRRLGGDAAAAATGLFMAGSPFVVASGRFVMADALGALLTVAALYAVSCRRLSLAGLLLGYGVVARLSASVLLVAVGQWRRAVVAGAGVLACLALFQTVAVGNPIGGYGDHAQFGASYLLSTGQPSDKAGLLNDGVSWPLGIAADRLPDQPNAAVQPNVIYYPGVLLWRWVFLPPLAGVAGLVEMWTRRRSDVGRFACLAVVANVAIFLPYYYQGARFVAPSGALLAVFAGLMVGRAAGSKVVAAATELKALPGLPDAAAQAVHDKIHRPTR